MGDPRIYVNVKWTTLKQLGEIDAYYAPYVSKGRNDFIELHDLTHVDNIYLTSILIPCNFVSGDSIIAIVSKFAFA